MGADDPGEVNGLVMSLESVATSINVLTLVQRATRTGKLALWGRSFLLTTGPQTSLRRPMEQCSGLHDMVSRASTTGNLHCL